MKALQTVGVGKAFRFVFYSIFSGVLRVSVLPQVRSILMTIAGARVGADAVVHNIVFSNLYHYGFRNLTIGKRCFLGDEAMLDCRGTIVLEDDVTISNRVNIVTHMNVGYPDHPLQKPYPTLEDRVIIKRGAYIGTAAILLPGVTIGRNSVVGAGAVVNKNVPAGSVVVGVPAKVVKKVKSPTSPPTPQKLRGSGRLRGVKKKP